MTKKKFNPIRDYPVYAENPAEYERVLRHNLSNCSKQQLIELAVMAAIEAERVEMDYQKARITAGTMLREERTKILSKNLLIKKLRVEAKKSPKN